MDTSPTSASCSSSPRIPGNIGAVARAMKNMGLERLVLVNPRQFPHSEATRARLRRRRRAGRCARVVASRRRGASPAADSSWRPPRASRDQYFRVADVREAAERMLSRSARAARRRCCSDRSGPGLTNEQLEAAHLLIRIPASEAYPSLNLAMAVQLVAYELFRARGVQIATAPAAGAARRPGGDGASLRAPRAGAGGDRFPRPHAERHPSHGAASAGCSQRAELDRNEVNILRGILTAVQSRRRRAGAAAERE